MMNNRLDKETGSALDETRFLAQLTAAATHELNNVLATIQERVGLIEDLVTMSQSSSNNNNRKISQSAQNIYHQIQRGVKQLTSLNRLSHGLDYKISQLNVYETLLDLECLCRRIAGLKGVEVAICKPESCVEISTQFFLFFQAVFLCFDICLNSASQGAQISMSLYQANGQVYIHFQTIPSGTKKEIRTDQLTYSEHWNSLKMLVSKLKGRISVETPARIYILSLPSTL